MYKTIRQYKTISVQRKCVCAFDLRTFVEKYIHVSTRNYLFYRLKRYPKIPHHLLKPLLRFLEGFEQKAVVVVPFGEAAVVEHFQIVLDDEGNDVVL